MDEPTTALDVVVQRDILAQIVELKERLGFSILIITHDLSLLLELADRIAVMYAGQLLEVGTAQQLHHAPAHPYTKGLLSSFPSLRGARRDLAGIPGSPPDLHDPPPGCPFLPRCGYGTSACTGIDMSLAPVARRRSRARHRLPLRRGPRRPLPPAPPAARPPRKRSLRHEAASTVPGSHACRRGHARWPRNAGRWPWRRSRSARTSGSAAVTCCTRSARSASACTAAPWSRSSAKAVRASRRLRGCSPGRSGPPAARSASTACRSTCPAAGPSGSTRARCSWSSRIRSRR